MNKILIFKRTNVKGSDSKDCIVYFLLYENELDSYKKNEGKLYVFYSLYEQNPSQSFIFCLSEGIMKDAGFDIQVDKECLIQFVDLVSVSFEEYMQFYKIIVFEYQLYLKEILDHLKLNWAE